MSSQTEPESKSALRLIKQLCSPWGRKHKLAGEELLADDPAAVPLIVECWNRLLQNSRHCLTVSVIATSAALISSVAAMLAVRAMHMAKVQAPTHLLHAGLSGFVLSGSLVVMCVSATVATLAMLPLLAFEKRRVQLAAVATRLSDKRLINILVEMLDRNLRPEGSVLIKGQARLTQLLMELQPSDANLVADRSRRILVRWLRINIYETTRQPGQADLASAIMSGLSTIGAANLRVTVHGLARHRAVTPHRRRLKDEAIRALERLDAWAELDRSGDILLRGSEQSMSDAGVLVRPSGTIEETGAELLRPGSETVPQVALTQPEEMRKVTINRTGTG
jgi:hypothetical protein